MELCRGNAGELNLHGEDGKTGGGGGGEVTVRDIPGPVSIPHHYTPDQILLFQGRYENGYDIFTDSDYIN